MISAKNSDIVLQTVISDCFLLFVCLSFVLSFELDFMPELGDF
ncbi:Uncharacterised protein [Porphyromonas crevioricanis]|uniref:Uncharacterized protein n=1 Tax=Porphyromonas crevioricanis TaxID=393921 RepID=A0A2X4SS37_9PORP|nr:hypothetical protein PORCAN_1580 [Porphyromonas crevioricanis JCM 13913]SQH72631.1 Uncharacterised protein [Porphyromonas crevioricanis]